MSDKSTADLHEPMGDEDEAPCCYGYVTSRGSDHEPDCPESARRED